MGMLVFFLRGETDCTNDGVSGHMDDDGNFVHKGFCVVNAEGPFSPSDDYPAAMLDNGPYDSLRLVPVGLKESGAWVMFGGNYASTSDSRWIDTLATFRRVDRKLAMNMAAVPVFDRVED